LDLPVESGKCTSGTLRTKHNHNLTPLRTCICKARHTQQLEELPNLHIQTQSSQHCRHKNKMTYSHGETLRLALWQAHTTRQCVACVLFLAVAASMLQYSPDSTTRPLLLATERWCTPHWRRAQLEVVAPHAVKAGLMIKGWYAICSACGLLRSSTKPGTIGSGGTQGCGGRPRCPRWTCALGYVKPAPPVLATQPFWKANRHHRVQPHSFNWACLLGL
jgi:hypothetical protein